VANLFEIEPDRVHEVSEDGRVLLPNNPLQIDQKVETPESLMNDPDPSPDLEKSKSPPLSNETLKTSTAKPEIDSKPAPLELHASSPETSLRVNVALLDSLMTLAGELVLGRNQLLQSLSKKDLDTSEAVGKRIDHITSELQEAIMRTRMQPIGNVFNKFPRVARDWPGNWARKWS
jgi:two-component system chemotaxis sensor kinase CheA